MKGTASIGRQLRACLQHFTNIPAGSAKSMAPAVLLHCLTDFSLRLHRCEPSAMHQRCYYAIKAQLYTLPLGCIHGLKRKQP